MPVPPSLNKLWISIPGKKRVRSPEYSAWLREAGWEIRRQLSGRPPIACRYNMDILVPVSRRDTGNHEKAISDCLQSAGAVVNDGNLHSLTVTPVEGRTDVAVCLTPLPGMGGVRGPAKALPNRGGYRKRPRKGGITTAMLVGLR